MPAPSTMRPVVEKYIFAEIEKNGIGSLNMPAIAKMFMARGVSRTRIYLWVKEAREAYAAGAAPTPSTFAPVAKNPKSGGLRPAPRREGVVDARAIRARTGLSLEKFARRFGLTLGAVRQWEAGLRRPETSAQLLLLIIAKHPQVVRGAVADLEALEEAAELAAVQPAAPAAG